jgi:hypothetical protein
MSGLPDQIIPQSMPLSSVKGEPVYFDLDWWLFLYNLSVQVLGTGGGGSTPQSPSDQLDADDLLAVEAEIPQAYRQIANVQALLQDPEIGPTFRDMANAFILATDPVLPDPPHAAQPVQTVTPGASPYTYTAAYNGTLSVSAGAVSAISIIRQGATVATGITAGLIPVSRSDQVSITYSVAPTVSFLPA